MRCSAVSIPFGSAARRAETHKIAAMTWIRKINALMLPMLMVPLSAALRHNCDLNIASLADDLLYNCFPEPFPPGARRTSHHEDLGDAVGAGELGCCAVRPHLLLRAFGYAGYARSSCGARRFRRRFGTGLREPPDNRRGGSRPCACRGG